MSPTQDATPEQRRSAEIAEEYRADAYLRSERAQSKRDQADRDKETARRASRQALVNATWISRHAAEIRLESMSNFNPYEALKAEIEEMTATLDAARADGIIADLEVATLRAEAEKAKADAFVKASHDAALRDGLASFDHTGGVQAPQAIAQPVTRKTTFVCAKCGIELDNDVPMHKIGNTWCVRSPRRVFATGRTVLWLLEQGNCSVEELRAAGIKVPDME